MTQEELNKKADEQIQIQLDRHVSVANMIDAAYRAGVAAGMKVEDLQCSTQ